ncbi:MAG: hypothetical protein L3K18_06075 [Thermoplasmata archaeon]|nr:hypothetical protein [Thermoplasmata archaeon]MCI4356691.1 hypothetical protein [Thermoplasmata archaeon]
MRLHTGGRLRRWLGARFGGDFEVGDRIYRRILHAAGAFAIVYLLVPANVLVVVSTSTVLLLALAVILLLEGLRHWAGWELPTIRSYEQRRVGSYVYYAVALTLALLLFPRPIAAAVVLGTALVDPLLGELRLRTRDVLRVTTPGFLVYFLLAFVALQTFGGGREPATAGLALLAGALAVAAEWPSWGMVDDDLAMTLVPGAVLTAIVLTWPGIL